jgi:hypothetical protein
MQVKEQQTKTSDNVTEVRKSTLLLDANGRFQVSEVRQGRIEVNGKNATKTEQVSRADSEGRLAVVARTVSKDSDSANGAKRQTVESYSSQVPGKADNEGLQLNQRVTTTTQAGTNGASSTNQLVEQRDPSGSNNGIQATQQTIDIVRPGPNGGTQEQQQSVSRDVNGNTSVVWIDNSQSSKSPAVAVSPKPTQSPATKPSAPAKSK